MASSASAITHRIHDIYHFRGKQSDKKKQKKQQQKNNNNSCLYWHTAFLGRIICLFLSWINMVYEDFVPVETHIILLAFRKLTFWLLLHSIYFYDSVA